MPATEPIGVLGAGSWGTALAIQLARGGRDVRLWGRDPQALARMASARENAYYLPGATFPESLKVEPALAVAARAHDVVIAVPSSGFRSLVLALAPLLRSDARVAWATKGFEAGSGFLPHQIVAEILGGNRPAAVLSGPTFAREVARGLPTAITVAANDAEFARALAEALGSAHFRAYTSTDIVGVEVGGAVKNVLAIATGIADGMGFGANTRSALITRGLAEMTRLGVALHARPETFMGLAALGDLVLTCTDDQSRNRRFGLALARGEGADAAHASIGQVVEGVVAARAVHDVACRLHVDMPITEQVYAVLYERRPLDEAVRLLMQRAIKAEDGGEVAL